MASEFKIGTTSGGITSLDALTTPLPDPQHDPREYKKMVKLGDSTLRGMGPRTIVWNFPLIEPGQVAQLETFFSTSARYIRSRKRDDSFGIFEVLITMPDPRQDGEHLFQEVRSGYTLEFIVLSEVV